MNILRGLGIEHFSLATDNGPYIDRLLLIVVSL